MVSHIILGSSLSGGPGRLGASPLERGGRGGGGWKLPGRDSDTKLEDVMSPRWGLG
jgi:hypothetical protein